MGSTFIIFAKLNEGRMSRWVETTYYYHYYNLSVRKYLTFLKTQDKYGLSDKINLIHLEHLILPHTREPTCVMQARSNEGARLPINIFRTPEPQHKHIDFSRGKETIPTLILAPHKVIPTYARLVGVTQCV